MPNLVSSRRLPPQPPALALGALDLAGTRALHVRAAPGRGDAEAARAADRPAPRPRSAGATASIGSLRRGPIRFHPQTTIMVLASCGWRGVALRGRCQRPMAGNDAAETRARHEPAVCRHSPKVCGTPVGKVTLVVIIRTNYSAAAYFLLASTRVETECIRCRQLNHPPMLTPKSRTRCLLCALYVDPRVGTQTEEFCNICL